MQQLIKELSRETGLTPSRIQNIYNEYWKAIKFQMSKENFDRDISEEDYYKEKHCFNIIGLGKLGVPYMSYKHKSRRKEQND